MSTTTDSEREQAWRACSEGTAVALYPEESIEHWKITHRPTFDAGYDYGYELGRLQGHKEGWIDALASPTVKSLAYALEALLYNTRPNKQDIALEALHNYKAAQSVS